MKKEYKRMRHASRLIGSRGWVHVARPLCKSDDGNFFAEEFKNKIFFSLSAMIIPSSDSRKKAIKSLMHLLGNIFTYFSITSIVLIKFYIILSNFALS
jgi:hypothetical protein